MTIIWVLVAVAAVVAEMLTGTLYLLVVGVAAGLAGVASSFALSVVVQGLVAAVVVVAGSLLVSRFRVPTAEDMAPDLQGGAELLSVAEGGKLRVRWRGTEWDGVRMVAEEALSVGDALVIGRQQGNVLHVSKIGS